MKRNSWRCGWLALGCSLFVAGCSSANTPTKTAGDEVKPRKSAHDKTTGAQNRWDLATAHKKFSALVAELKGAFKASKSFRPILESWLGKKRVASLGWLSKGVWWTIVIPDTTSAQREPLPGLLLVTDKKDVTKGLSGCVPNVPINAIALTIRPDPERGFRLAASQLPFPFHRLTQPTDFEWRKTNSGHKLFAMTVEQEECDDPRSDMRDFKEENTTKYLVCYVDGRFHPLEQFQDTTTESPDSSTEIRHKLDWMTVGPKQLLQLTTVSSASRVSSEGRNQGTESRRLEYFELDAKCKNLTPLNPGKIKQLRKKYPNAGLPEESQMHKVRRHGFVDDDFDDSRQ
jgi:hypothetical protein